MPGYHTGAAMGNASGFGSLDALLGFTFPHVLLCFRDAYGTQGVSIFWGLVFGRDMTHC